MPRNCGIIHGNAPFVVHMSDCGPGVRLSLQFEAADGSHREGKGRRYGAANSHDERSALLCESMLLLL